MSVMSDNETRALLRACKSKFGLMRHQIESYDHFVQRMLPVIVKENSTLIVTCPAVQGSLPRQIEFTFGEVYIQPPSVKDATGFVRNITPAIARVCGQTYASSVLVDVEQRTLELGSDGPRLVERKLYRELLLCRLPIMVGSSGCHLYSHSAVGTECVYDDGGYFIIDGMEKVVISQEKLRTNFPYVFPPRRTVITTLSGKAKSILACEVRSSHESKLRSTSTLVIHLLEPVNGAAPEIMVVLPYLECPVPLAWLLRLLGWVPGGEIERMLMADHSEIDGSFRTIATLVAASLEDSGRRVTPESVLHTLGTKGTYEADPERRDRYVSYICRSETLPHMGVDESPDTQIAKRTYLYHMVSKLLGVWLGLATHDDRDHYANKRVDTAGPLMAHLFRQLYRSFLKSLQSQIQRAVVANKFVDLMDTRYVNHRRISGGFKAAFGTGNWGLPKIAGGAGSAVGQVGITQALSQQTGISATAQGRRLNTPLNSQGRNPRPRQLSNSAWGVVCSTETPEGIQCGLVKNLAWGARVRVATPTSVLLVVVMAARSLDGHELVVPLHTVASSRLQNGSYSCIVGSVMVTVNGYIAGYCRSAVDAEALSVILRRQRRYQEIPFDTTVAYLRDSWQAVIRVHADLGCLLRPVLVLSELSEAHRVLARFAGAHHAEVELWAALLEAGAIEYIDKDEESTLRVAEAVDDTLPSSPIGARAIREMQPFTHAELHASVIHGVCASLIPFSNHNQSPRNTYQSAMGKQALGIPTINHSQRLDSVMHVLCSPERPLVATWMDDMTSSRGLPAGQNVMVAILCHSGFNQEDSIIMCQSSIDAGLFGSVVYRTYKEETRPGGTDIERVEVPDPSTCTRLKAASYDHLDPETGGARVGARLRSGDVVIGKTVTTTDSQRGGGKVRVTRDKSQQLRNSEDGTVDRVVVTSNREGQRTVRVRTAQHRVPEIGDKFSSRHGQKGVIGMTRARRDMPFTTDGRTPDIIVNPHAIPSRMTIGHLFETLLGEEAAQAGQLGDGTPFRDLSVDQVANALAARGLDRYNDVVMHCGLTGRRMQAMCFFGPTYYQRLRHMVHDKVHARARGPVQPITRQPVEGRSHDGGLRIGEMERDCMASHGASANVRECLFEKSDPYVTHVCRGCGLLADPPTISSGGWCHNCGNSTLVGEVAMPFACQLTLQEITALHITPRLQFQANQPLVAPPNLAMNQGITITRPSCK